MVSEVHHMVGHEGVTVNDWVTEEFSRKVLITHRTVDSPCHADRE